MQRIHDIIISPDRICRCLVHLLGPVRGPHQDHRIGIFPPDHRDHLGRIISDLLPGGASVGFIADLVEDMIHPGKFSGHFIEKGFCLRCVFVGVPVVQHMPVQDHIQILFLCCPDPLPDLLFQGLPVASAAVPAVLIRVHCDPKYIGSPFLPHLLQAGLVHILGEPGQSVGTDAPKLDRLPAGAHQPGPFHVKSTRDGGTGEDSRGRIRSRRTLPESRERRSAAKDHQRRSSSRQGPSPPKYSILFPFELYFHPYSPMAARASSTSAS